MSELQRPSSDLLAHLYVLQDALERMHFPFALRDADEISDVVADSRSQLRDYLIPRLENLSAPLVCVVGGSTGAGKSAIVNSLVGENVVRSSAIRPTTRRPTLVFHPDDAEAFADARILPDLARVSGETDEHSSLTLELVPSQAIPAGLALLDSPDIDSVVEENRQFASQLLAAADLWIFVTTAARYGDAIPWVILGEAAERNIVLGIVLNRVPPGVGADVRADLASRLEKRALAHAPLFMIAEQQLEDGRLANADVESVRRWLMSIAEDEAARASVIRQTLHGAVHSLSGHASTILDGYGRQLATRDALRWDVDSAFAAADEQFAQNVVDGSLLRGEVLSRWQDVVGTGEWMRRLEGGVSAIRDRLSSYFTTRTNPSTTQIEFAIDDGVIALLVERTEAAIAQALRAWESVGVAEALVKHVRENLRDRSEREAVAAELIHDWRADILEIVREQGTRKKTMARALATSVNVVGVALIVVVFASTGGLVGGEVAVAGGTAVVAQKLLEAIFGEDAVRRLARQAKKLLDDRVENFVRTDRRIFEDALESTDISQEIKKELETAFAQIDGEGKIR